MAMDWLKGLVGPVAQFSPTGQPIQAPPGGAQAFPPGYGGSPGGGPPMGSAPPPGAWGPPPGAWDPNTPPAGGVTPTYGAGMPGVDPNAYGATFGSSGYGSGPVSSSSYGSPPPSSFSGAAAPGPGAPADARIVQLENRVEELKRDLESVALFAQTLLAVLEDKKVMTQPDFQEMRRKLDLLDGRLDDRIGKAS